MNQPLSLIRKATLCLLCCVSLLLPLIAQSSDSNMNDRFDKQALHDYIVNLHDDNRAMMNVVISRNGETIFSQQTGFSHVESSLFRSDEYIKTTEDTPTKIASITKIFVSVLIHQLIDEQKLSLETPLSTFYPNVVNAQNITIKNLLEHSSGIFNYIADERISEFIFVPHSKEALLTRIEAYPSVFPPGNMSRYSNSNYILLGFIIEDLYQKPFEVVLKQNITDKLNLSETRYCHDLDACQFETQSYSYWNGKWAEVPDWHQSILYTTGGITSTAADLTTFINALFNGELITAKSLGSMTEDNYGFAKGIFKYDFSGYTGYGHDGLVENFNSQLIYYPQLDLTFVMLINALHDNPQQIFNNVKALYFGTSTNIPKFNQAPIDISTLTLDNYIGTYKSITQQTVVNIYVENGKLMASLDGLNHAELTPLSEEDFENKFIGFDLHFFGKNNTEGHYIMIKSQYGGSEETFYRK